jgi:copper homeostasis protein
MAVAASKSVPCFALIRPRAGDFCYDRREVDLMLRDIDMVRTTRLAGVVIGASLGDGSLDVATLRRLLEHSAGLPAVLHRAFDLVPDFPAALEPAIGLGFKRVLTSGGGRDALSGRNCIGELVAQAGDRIEVMPGGGLSVGNVAQFVRDTGVRVIHSSCSSPVPISDNAGAVRATELGFIPANYRVTDSTVVAGMVAELTGLSGG